jgi:hypothetical protein
VPAWEHGNCRIILMPVLSAAGAPEGEARTQIEAVMQRLATADDTLRNTTLQELLQPALKGFAQQQDLKGISLTPDEPSFSTSRLLLAGLTLTGDTAEGQRQRVTMIAAHADAALHVTVIQAPEAESKPCTDLAEGLLASYAAAPSSTDPPQSGGM